MESSGSGTFIVGGTCDGYFIDAKKLSQTGSAEIMGESDHVGLVCFRWMSAVYHQVEGPNNLKQAVFPDDDLEFFRHDSDGGRGFDGRNRYAAS